MGLDAIRKVANVLLIEAEEKSDDDAWIGVDLDGTLAEYDKWRGATHIGDPIPKMANRIRRWVGRRKKVKIFTARADDERSVNAIKKWLKDNELPDLEITNLKDEHMTELWDDKAIAVQKNTGEVKEAQDPHMIAWARQLIASLNDGGIWGIPDTGQVFQFNHRDKVIQLIEGPANDAQGWTPRLKELFATLGYRLLTHRGEDDEMTVIEAIVQRAIGENYGEPLPPRAYQGDDDAELEVAARQPFTAHELAVSRNKHHPKLWQRVKGSPFENDYRRRFNVRESVQVVLDSILHEAPQFKTLKAHQVKLSEQERGQAGESPIKKSVVNGESWYWSNTHRCYQAHSTMKAALTAYRDIVEPSG